MGCSDIWGYPDYSKNNLKFYGGVNTHGSIVGVEFTNEKRVEIGLTYIYGIGTVKARDRILEEVQNVDPSTRVRDLTDDEVKRISAVIIEQIYC